MINMEELKNLSIGDTFELGVFNNDTIEWKILEKDENQLYAVSVYVLAHKEFSKTLDRHWSESFVRTWLNDEFYNSAFSEEEKKIIKTVNKDNITLMTTKEASTIISSKDRKAEAEWWLRTPYSTLCESYVSLVSKNGYLYHDICNQHRGIRPALHIKLQ